MPVLNIKIPVCQKKYAALVAIAITLAFGLYFRTYPLNPFFSSLKSNQAIAEESVQREMRDQIFNHILSSSPQLPLNALRALTDKRMIAAVRQEPLHYQKAVNKSMRTLSKRRLPSDQKDYLLGSDSYYYLYLTDLVRQTGSLSTRFKNGRYFDFLREAPQGSWVNMTLHPYFGYYWSSVFNFFSSDIPLSKAVAFYPLLIFCLSTLALFILCYPWQVKIFPSLLGGLCFVLSPVYIERSALGWYDTDPYNILFPILILITLFYGVRREKSGFLAGCGGGSLNALYALFWVGWPLMFMVILTSVIWLLVRDYWKTKQLTRVLAQYLFGFVLSGSLLLCLFLTPQGVFEIVSHGLKSMQMFGITHQSAWPNIFMVVGETRPLGFVELIQIIGNPISVAIMIYGVLYSLHTFNKRKDTAGIYQWAVLVILSLTILILSLRASRFALILTIPLALFSAYGFTGLYDGMVHHVLPTAAKKWPRALSLGHRWMAISAGILLIILLLPMQLVNAHSTAFGLPQIMNDTWALALSKTQKKTPEKALIFSWWSPGHFIKALAKRGVILDGATQHLPETYWMARFFMSRDEKEAVGILRMLYISKNQAVDFLQTLGMKLADAVELIEKLISRSRSEAKRMLPDSLSEADRQKLLDLTHGTVESLGPAYVLVYDSLMIANPALQLIAHWDFRKAEDLTPFLKRELGKTTDKRLARTRAIISISGRLLQHQPAEEPIRQEGSDLYFKSGLGIDRKTRAAWYASENQQAEGKPASVLYVRNGQLEELKNKDPLINMSVLLFEHAGIQKSVMAERPLMTTMLYSLAYLEGQTLKFLKPAVREFDAKADQYVYVFEIDWEAFRLAT